MLSDAMKRLGIIHDPNVVPVFKTKTAESAATPQLGELTVKQWKDSAGSYHTEVVNEQGYLLNDWYALTKLGASRHAYRARRYARRYLAQRKQGRNSQGWEVTGDFLQPKKREFKVTK